MIPLFFIHFMLKIFFFQNQQVRRQNIRMRKFCYILYCKKIKKKNTEKKRKRNTPKNGHSIFNYCNHLWHNNFDKKKIKAKSLHLNNWQHDIIHLKDFKKTNNPDVCILSSKMRITICITLYLSARRAPLYFILWYNKLLLNTQFIFRW